MEFCVFGKFQNVHQVSVASLFAGVYLQPDGKHIIYWYLIFNTVELDIERCIKSGIFAFLTRCLWYKENVKFKFFTSADDRVIVKNQEILEIFDLFAVFVEFDPK